MGEQERMERLAQVCNMYYNEGKTQIEIAKELDTTRFKVAKWLQEARVENVVNISINTKNYRSCRMEELLRDSFNLKHVVVLNTQYLTYAETLRDLGKLGAAFLNKHIVKGCVVGVTWGKTLQALVGSLVPEQHASIDVVQIAGCATTNNPPSDSPELVKLLAAAYNGKCHFLYAPLYARNESMAESIKNEPVLKKTLETAKKMDIVVTGLGGLSSIPLQNPVWREYVSAEDLLRTDIIGSIYGRVMVRDGDFADIPLNRKLISVSMEDIMNADLRVLIAQGRNKADAARAALQRQYANVLITDINTALTIGRAVNPDLQ